MTATRRLVPWLIPVAAIAYVMSPMLLTHRSFGTDWPNHLWLIAVQGHAVAQTGSPSLFLNASPLGVLYPQFAFYGGTLYAIAGGLSAVLGDHPVVAYLLSWLVGFAMLYGSVSWAAVQAGLHGAVAQLPGLMAVTAAYPLTNAYARGAWPEFMATAAIPLVVAGAWHLLRAPRWGALPVAGFTVGVVVMTGSHNITLLWGSLFLVVLSLLAVVALPRHGREIPMRRPAAVLGLMLLGAGVNLWFLLPDLVYQGRTIAASIFGINFGTLEHVHFGALGNLFALGRSTPAGSTTPSLDVQLPVLALAWSLAAATTFRRGMTASWRRLTLGLVVVAAAVVIALAYDPLWRHVPAPLDKIQYPYRLESYAIVVVAGLMIAALVASRAAPRRLRSGALWILIACLVPGIVVAGVQIWGTPVNPVDRGEALASITHTPPSWYDPGTYRDDSGRSVATRGRLTFDPARAHGDAIAAVVPDGRGGDALASNVGTGTYLAHVAGVQPLGRTSGSRQRKGFLVVRAPSGRAGPATVRVSPADTAPVLAGRWATFASVAALLALLAVLVARAARRTRRRAAGSTRPGRRPAQNRR